MFYNLYFLIINFSILFLIKRINIFILILWHSLQMLVAAARAPTSATAAVVKPVATAMTTQVLLMFVVFRLQQCDGKGFEGRGDA